MPVVVQYTGGQSASRRTQAATSATFRCRVRLAARGTRDLEKEHDMPADHIQVHTTTGKREDADRIAALLVEDRFAACVQVTGPITSTYRWQGKIETAEEWLCVAKTRQALYGRVEASIKEAHPYETPEIIATPIVAGSDDYLSWIEGQTRDA